MKEKVIIIAPFVHIESNVGRLRIERFIRWLGYDNYSIILIRSGETDQIITKDHWLEIAIHDPLKIRYNNLARPLSKWDKIKRIVAYLLLMPDPGIIWARKVIKHKYIDQYCQGATKILSSSPPESSHWLGSALAKKLNSELIIDLRDGWLDESLKPILRSSRCQRWRESRIEKKILTQAKIIFVTSATWKQLLNQRLPFTTRKTIVLTNACPVNTHLAPRNKNSSTTNNQITLVYTGRFRLSYPGRHPTILLNCLFSAIDTSSIQANILLIGAFITEDINEIKSWQDEFSKKGWNIEVSSYINREKLSAVFDQADGFLLLSDSIANLPAKAFEYLATKKPILVVGNKGSAVELLATDIPQAFFCDYQNNITDISSKVAPFLQACANQSSIQNISIPEQYCEEYLSSLFLKALNY